MRKITKKSHPTVTMLLCGPSICVLLTLFDGPMGSTYVGSHMEQAIKLSAAFPCLISCSHLKGRVTPLTFQPGETFPGFPIGSA